MNPVLILSHNCLALTKKCVESALAQDIPTKVLVFDNGSSDGTSQWLPDNSDQEARVLAYRSSVNRGVSVGWNWGLNYWFNHFDIEHVLVVNNDVILPQYFYREVLSYDDPLVTGFDVRTLWEITVCPPRQPLQPHPDFSAFVIRREAWERVGPFDETIKNYCGDCDYHVRGHQLGVAMSKATVPYYHERSSTTRLAPPAERAELRRQGDLDKAAFKSKWGCVPGTKQYEELFK